MDSLSDSTWDVVISGTGLPQSLLALALSRSGKKVLHIDKHDYYGSAEAALSLQEVESWADTIKKDDGQTPFRCPVSRDQEQDTHAAGDGKPPKLGFSRAYSLSLSPQLIYTRSNLLPALVSSKVYHQLEFLAVGSWWIYNTDGSEEDGSQDEGTKGLGATKSKGSLRRIPGGREDVFADKSIDLRSTRPLMKFLKLAADSEAHVSVLKEWGEKPFPDFLSSHLKISSRLQPPLLALTLSPNTPTETLTAYALPNIHRHLTSIGMFGPGFGSVIPKWGGLAEVAQVACRASAVGGGVYVLKKGFEKDEDTGQQSPQRAITGVDEASQISTLRLEDGELIKTHWIVGSKYDLPSQIQESSDEETVQMARSITVVSSSLSQLFPSQGEGAPSPAGTLVVYPTGTIEYESGNHTSNTLKTEQPPVYLMIHSSDTGECPGGQCVIYGQTMYLIYNDAHSLLRTAIHKFLVNAQEDQTLQILWDLHYDQYHIPPATANDYDVNIQCDQFSNDHVLQLPDLAPELVLEDDVLKHVRAAWQRIMGEEAVGFMLFEDREGVGNDDEGGEM